MAVTMEGTWRPWKPEVFGKQEKWSQRSSQGVCVSRRVRSDVYLKLLDGTTGTQKLKHSLMDGIHVRRKLATLESRGLGKAREWDRVSTFWACVSHWVAT